MSISAILRVPSPYKNLVQSNISLGTPRYYIMNSLLNPKESRIQIISNSIIQTHQTDTQLMPFRVHGKEVLLYFQNRTLTSLISFQDIKDRRSFIHNLGSYICRLQK